MPKLTAVILAGGFGKRLASVLGNRPKVLAEVGGYPFIAYLLDQLAFWRIPKVILCIGHLAEQIKDQLGESHKTVKLLYSQEFSPLGTAGALRRALSLIKSNTVLVMNGDSYCDVNLNAFYKWHSSHNSEATLLLINSLNTKRYGSVQIDSEGHIIHFVEKGENTGPGLINAGIYLITRALLERIPETSPISLEHEILPSWIGKRFFGYQTPGPFLDIGTPESYSTAEVFFSGKNPS